MPVQTRGRAPPARVYSTQTPQRQMKFEAKRRLVNSRGKTSSIKQSNQKTLTQIEFVSSLPDSNDDDDDEDSNRVDGDEDDDDGDDPTSDSEREQDGRRRKRRRIMKENTSSRKKHYTQTLTQFEFLKAPSEDKIQDSDIQEGHCDLASTGRVPDSVTPPRRIPTTPKRSLKQEIPSSQSPCTPLSSAKSSRILQGSILRDRSTNIGSPLKRFSKCPSPGIKIENDVVTSKASRARLMIGDYQRSISFKERNTLSKSAQPRNSQRWPEASPEDVKLLLVPALSKHEQKSSTNVEIKDSDAESDEDMTQSLPDTWNLPIKAINSRKSLSIATDEANEALIELNNDTESLPRICEKQVDSSLTESQEADAQLKCTMRQFTQANVLQLHPSAERSSSSSSLSSLTASDPITPAAVRKENGRRAVRSSQATTVDLTQPSSPGLVRSSPYKPVDVEFVPDSQVPTPGSVVSLPQHVDDASSSSPNEGPHEDTPVLLSMASSDLLSRSQMLPDSLMKDSSDHMPPPSSVVGDSEDEEAGFAE